MIKNIYGTDICYVVVNKHTDGNTLGDDLGEFDEDIITLCNSQQGEDLLQCMVHEEIHVINEVCCLTQAISHCVDQVAAELISKWLVKNYHMLMKKGSIKGTVPKELSELMKTIPRSSS